MEHQGTGPWEHGRGPDFKAKAGQQESRQWRWVDIVVRISLHTGPELGHPWWSGGWSGCERYRSMGGAGIKWSGD